MGTRAQNEKKFAGWEAMGGGGRLYTRDVEGRAGWRARYFKEVDSNEVTVRFWQEIYDHTGKFVERHEKFPVDKGHEKV
jgi:hypothetical protein